MPNRFCRARSRRTAIAAFVAAMTVLAGGITGAVVAAGPAGASPPSAGVLARFAGTGTSGAPAAGPATASDLETPAGVVVDANGNTYISDASAHQVVKVDAAGTLSIFAGTGIFGAPVAGPATSSPLNGPFGLGVDGGGNVYIADGNNHRVEKVTPSGTLSLFAGTGSPGVVTPGPALSSPVQSPSGIAVDGSGNVYIVDEDNYSVDKVTPSGTLSVFAGGSPRSADRRSRDRLAAQHADRRGHRPLRQRAHRR